MLLGFSIESLNMKESYFERQIQALMTQGTLGLVLLFISLTSQVYIKNDSSFVLTKGERRNLRTKRK